MKARAIEQHLIEFFTHAGVEVYVGNGEPRVMALGDTAEDRSWLADRIHGSAKIRPGEVRVNLAELARHLEDRL